MFKNFFIIISLILNCFSVKVLRLRHKSVLFSSQLGIIMLICLYHKITVREEGTATCPTPHVTQWKSDTR